MEASKKKMKFPSAFSITLYYSSYCYWPNLAYSVQGPTLNFPMTAPKIILLSKPTEFPIKAIQQQNKP